MAIRHAKKKANFTQISNDIFRDKRLSYEAKGVLCTLLSMPYDWVIYKSWIQEQSANCGKDKLSRILKELQSFGYLELDQTREKNGKFAGNDYLLHEAPINHTVDGFAVSGKAASGKPAPTNTDLINNTDLTNITGYENATHFTHDKEKIDLVSENVDDLIQSTYRKKVQFNDLDYQSFDWALGIFEDSFDDGACFIAFSAIIDTLGEPEKILNPFVRAMHANLPDHLWIEKYEAAEDDLINKGLLMSYEY